MTPPATKLERDATSRCRLTSRGRALVEEFTNIVRKGGALPSAYKLEDDSGFFLLDEGSHRLVFAESKSARDGPEPRMFESGVCVLKVAKFDDPWPNRNEILNYEFAPDSIRQFLAPVHQWAHDGMWLTMDRADIGGSYSDAEYIEDQIADAGYRLDDIRKDNVGSLDGRGVVIDYGFRIYTPDDEGRDVDRVGPKPDEFFAKSPQEKRMEEFFG